MNKKSGFNIVFFVFMTSLILIISCTKSVKTSGIGQLIMADRDFSSLSEKEGMHKAFLEFIADSGVLLRDNAYPLVGKTTLATLFSKGSDTSFVLTWDPVYEKISSSADLGYTYGYYTRKVKSTGEVIRGTYLTIWKKQSDGTWKFVLDTGTQGLSE